MQTFGKEFDKIAYEYHQSEGATRTIVLIHGAGLDHRIWKSQVDSLRRKKVNVLTYDMRGYGGSSKPVSDYSHHSDLDALLDHLEVTEAELTGMSYGGEVAIDFALEHPEKVKRLTLIGSALGGYNPSPDPAIIRWSESLGDGRVEEVKTEMADHKALRALQEAKRAEVRAVMEGNILWHFQNRDPITRLHPSANSRLGEIECPTTVLVGASDSENQILIAKRLETGIENAHLHIVEGSHFLNIEHPELVTHVILEGKPPELDTERLSEHQSGLNMA